MQNILVLPHQRTWQTIVFFAGTGLGPFVPVKGNLNASIERDFMQLCASDFVAAVWERLSRGCDGQLSTNI